MSDFLKAFNYVVGLEGGYVDNPEDPGGETKYGISKKSYPDLNIKNLTPEQAQGIYYEDYWQHIHGDELIWPLNCLVFDSAVNQGVHHAIIMMQQALQTNADGIIGPQTLSLAKKASNYHMARFMYLRQCAYRKLPTYSTFGEGWEMRLYEILLKV